MSETQTAKSKGWPIAFKLVKNKTDKNGNPFLDEAGNPVEKRSVQIPKNVTILVDGVKVEHSGYANLVRPLEEVERKIKAGYIPEEKIEAARAAAKQASEWLIAEVVVPPPRKK